MSNEASTKIVKFMIHVPEWDQVGDIFDNALLLQDTKETQRLHE